MSDYKTKFIPGADSTYDPDDRPYTVPENGKTAAAWACKVRTNPDGTKEYEVKEIQLPEPSPDDEWIKVMW